MVEKKRGIDITEAIVLAGGLGTRLQSVVNALPKSMAPVNGRPFLEYLFDYLLEQGIRRVVLSVGYKREAIIDHFHHQYKDLEIDYAIEETPLGTGGGIRLALWKINGLCSFALNGDSLFRVDYRKMAAMHAQKNADITLALRRLKDTSRYGRVALARDHRITGFYEKNQETTPGYINGGVYLLNKLFLMDARFRGKFSIEKECFEPDVTAARFFGFPSNGYFLDIGIPSDYKKAQNEFRKMAD